ncbi:MAG: hypothetical protein KatS3mg110_0324 [Pirellulaceae bacterium]|nr:MAG: hypothetical protein KatS3mg110_0324 [Pirellulaceae bacterium]
MDRGATFFMRTCPTCGRPTRVRVEWLGREVRCMHCQATFLASNPDQPESETLLDCAERWLAIADELLRSWDRPRVDISEI